MRMTLCRRGRSVFSRTLVCGLAMSLIGRYSRPKCSCSSRVNTFARPELRGAAARSNQPQRLEARVALAADDDVVVQGNPERAGGFDDLLGHLHVGARGARIAGGMVVHEDERARRELERALDHLAGLDRRVVDGADLLALVRDQLVALVE